MSNIIWNKGNTPNKSGKYIVSLKFEPTEWFKGEEYTDVMMYSTDLHNICGGQFFDIGEKGWYHYCEAYGDYTPVKDDDTKVVAWAEMPEPYKGD